MQQPEMPPLDKRHRGEESSGGKASTRVAASQADKPKRFTTAYFFWLNGGGRAAIMEEHPGLKVRPTEEGGPTIGSIAGAKWKEMAAEEKSPWEAKAKADKERYEAEMKAYKSLQDTATADAAEEAETSQPAPVEPEIVD